jgi:hypothetical protein
MGAILRAWWPEDPKRIEPGPKFRPVLFLAETEIQGIPHLVVAYGTTKTQQHKETRNGGDIFVRVTDGRQVTLNADTRFDFNQLRALPATTDFFASNKRSPIIKTSELPHHLYPQAIQAMKCADVPRALVRYGISL